MAGISKKRIKTKNGDVIKYTITYYDIYGKQHTSGIYNTRKEAKKDLIKYEMVKTKNMNPTFGEIWQYYITDVSYKLAETTIENYKNCYKNYLIKLKDIKYKNLNSIFLQQFFNDIERKAPYVAQMCLKICKAATNKAIKKKLINYNIFKEEIEKIETPKADINHLTIAEIKKVLETCKIFKPKYYAMLYLFIGSGMREGELFALNVEDFNYESFSIDVNKQFTKGKLKHKTKTQSSNRVIYLFPDLAEEIKRHIDTLPIGTKILFPNEAGNYQNANNIRSRFWKPLLEKSGIKKRVRLHDLRGSYIDLVLSSGLSGKFAQTQAGHSKWETTYNVYAQNNEDMVKNAQETINKVFKKCEQKESKKENKVKNNVISFLEQKAKKGIKKESHDS